jgi:hypothetical protein
MSIQQAFNTSGDLDFPNVLPTLDLDFANSKTLDPRITFTRSSGGSYVGPDGILRYAGVNEARFDHDPNTGESLGLLIEESRTNLLLRSEDLNTSWNKINCTISANSVAAPDGLTTADLLIESLDATNITHTAAQNVNIVSGTVYTFSAFIKAAPGARNVFLFVSNTNFSVTPGALFNLSNGTVSGIQNATASITSFPNGWYRCVLTTVAATSSGANAFNFRLGNGSTTSYVGDGISGIYIWGAQVEAASFPTSYIPTTASTVTRSADTPNITNTTSFFNSTEGTLFVDSEIPYQTNSKFPSIGFVRGPSAGSNNAIEFYYYNTSAPYAVFLVRNSAAAGDGGIPAANLIESPGPTQTVGSYKKFVGTYKFGEINYYFDGNIVAKTNTNKALPTSLTYMEIGTYGNTDNRLNGHIRRITYYPKALPNTQLQSLTA